MGSGSPSSLALTVISDKIIFLNYWRVWYRTEFMGCMDSTPVGSTSPQWEFSEVWWLHLYETITSLLSCSLHGIEEQLLTLNLHSIQNGSNVEAFWSVSKILLHRDLSILGAFRRRHEMKDAILRKIRRAFLRGEYSIEDKTKHRLREYFTWLVKCLSKDHGYHTPFRHFPWMWSLWALALSSFKYQWLQNEFPNLAS